MERPEFDLLTVNFVKSTPEITPAKVTVSDRLDRATCRVEQGPSRSTVLPSTHCPVGRQRPLRMSICYRDL